MERRIAATELKEIRLLCVVNTKVTIDDHTGINVHISSPTIDDQNFKSREDGTCGLEAKVNGVVIYAADMKRMDGKEYYIINSEKSMILSSRAFSSREVFQEIVTTSVFDSKYGIVYNKYDDSAVPVKFNLILHQDAIDKLQKEYQLRFEEWERGKKETQEFMKWLQNQ
jgi:hypothetical protein